MEQHRWRTHFYLALSSLFIAFTIWLIAKQSDLATDWLSLSLRLENVPANMDVTGPNEVQINVQFPIELKNRIVPKNFNASIDATEIFSNDPAEWPLPITPKEVEYTLKRDNIVSVNLPPTVQILGMDPKKFILKASLNAKSVLVKVATTGKLPSYFNLTADPQPDPAEVWITGPPDVFDPLAELSTTPVDLSTLRGSGEVYRELVLPEKIVLLNPRHSRVTVNVGLTVVTIAKTIDGVAVTLLNFSDELVPRIEPDSGVDVQVEGPRAILDTLTAGDFVVEPTEPLTEEAQIEQEFLVEVRLKKKNWSEDLAKQIKIVNWNPKKFTVTFVPER